MNRSPVKVLIVEDVDVMAHLVQLVVQEIDGFVVTGMARNGAEARLELTRRFPDLVLLDEVLPGESSLDLLEELRSLKVPVILLTSMRDRTEPLPEGALARMLKPTWKTLKDDKIRIADVLSLFHA
ncbi:MAG: response regulator [Oligoflexia bacterium]|nr:response regulator [Oligoflexia bacterium]